MPRLIIEILTNGIHCAPDCPHIVHDKRTGPLWPLCTLTDTLLAKENSVPLRTTPCLKFGTTPLAEEEL